MMYLIHPVLANDLHQADKLPISWDSQDFPGGGDCDSANLAPGEVLWHFVHTGTDGTNLPATLDAHFTTAGDLQADGYSNGGGNAIVMYDIITGHDTLESASDSISDDNLLNLSHICVGPEQSVEESVAQSVEQSVAESQPESVAESVEQSVAESQAESVAESVAESAPESVAESVEQSVAESEAESVAESVEQSVAGSVEQSVAESVEQSVAESEPASVAESGEQSVEAGTGTPEESQSNTAFGLGGSNPLPTIAFGLILLASLSGLAFVNVKAARNRN